MRLGEILIGQGLATPGEIEAALRRQRTEGGRLGATLVSMGVLSVEQLLNVLRNQRESGPALAICQQTLERWETLYGAIHPNTSRAHYNLARALMIAGHAAEAAHHAEVALAGHTKALGRNHSCTQDAARLLAEAKRALAHAGGAELAEAAG